MVTTDAVKGSDLLSSIALVRELLKQNPSHVNTELSFAQQSRYESSVLLEEEQKAHREIVEDLQFQIEQAKHEARQEKIIRLSLEETNEALELHAAELSARLDALSTSTVLPSRQAEAEQQHAESITLLESQISELNSKLVASEKELDEAKASVSIWKSNCHQSQRQVTELHVQLATIKKEFQTMHDRRDFLLRDEETNYESFQKRLEDSIAARRIAKDELHSIRGSHSAASDVERLASSSEISEWKLKYEEALVSMKRVEDEAIRLEAEISVLKQQELASPFSPDVTEEDREVMAKMVNKVTELNGLYATLRKEARRGTSANEPKDGNEPTLANSESIFCRENSMSKLNHYYTVLQIKVEECISEFIRIRDDLKTGEEQAIEKSVSDKSGASPRQSQSTGTEDDTATRAEAALTTNQVVGKRKALVVKSKLGLEKRVVADHDGAAAKRKKKE